MASRAFTLVELLIVIVVLGILAAVIIPQFSGAVTDATRGSLAHQLLILNDQITIYIARHKEHPDFANDGWGTQGDETSLIGGAYLKDAPRNPAWPDSPTSTSVEVVNGNVFGSATAAWVWNTDDLTLYASYFDESTGEVTGNATD